MRRLLSGAGYVPMVTQTLMYISLEGRLPMQTSPQVGTIQPEEVETWSQMVWKRWVIYTIGFCQENNDIKQTVV